MTLPPDSSCANCPVIALVAELRAELAETQTARQTYDHIEIPPIKPIITQITLMEGVCPCCGKPFKAKALAGLEPSSPTSRSAAMSLPRDPLPIHN
jgi:hypothetical protein